MAYTAGPVLPPLAWTDQGAAGASFAGDVSPASSVHVPEATGPVGAALRGVERFEMERHSIAALDLER